MRFVLYTHFYSPHELPLFKATAQVFDEAWYVVDQGWNNDPSRKGWQPDLTGLNTIVLESLPVEARGAALTKLLDEQTLIMYGTRGNPYEAAIQSSPARVIYASERWLKPSRFLPGICHLLSPSFLRTVLRFRRWMKQNPRFSYFGLGVHAVRDMAGLMGWGRVVSVDRVPAGCVRTSHGVLPHLRIWGYFVESFGAREPLPSRRTEGVRVLWVGRMLKLKRIETILKALARIPDPKVTLTLVGDGPEKGNLLRLTESLALADRVTFRDFVPMQQVPEVMRAHDVYVFSSNAHEGWGAVVNEALEAGMTVLSTRATGAGVTLLPEECLFDEGDDRALAEKIVQVKIRPGLGLWNPHDAACALKEFACQEHG